MENLYDFVLIIWTSKFVFHVNATEILTHVRTYEIY